MSQIFKVLWNLVGRSTHRTQARLNGKCLFELSLANFMSCINLCISAPNPSNARTYITVKIPILP